MALASERGVGLEKLALADLQGVEPPHHRGRFRGARGRALGEEPDVLRRHGARQRPATGEGVAEAAGDNRGPQGDPLRSVARGAAFSDKVTEPATAFSLRESILTQSLRPVSGSGSAEPRRVRRGPRSGDRRVEHGARRGAGGRGRVCAASAPRGQARGSGLSWLAPCAGFAQGPAAAGARRPRAVPGSDRRLLGFLGPAAAFRRDGAASVRGSGGRSASGDPTLSGVDEAVANLSGGSQQTAQEAGRTRLAGEVRPAQDHRGLRAARSW